MSLADCLLTWEEAQALHAPTLGGVWLVAPPGMVVNNANSRWPSFAGTWRDFVSAKSVMRVSDVYRCAGLL